MMQKGFTTLIAFFFCTLVFAQQTSVIQGRITDKETNMGLPGATILYARDRGTVSDQEGYYLLSISPGSYALTFQYVGYKSLSVPISVRPGESIQLDLALTPDITEIEQVIVSAGRVEQRVGESTVSVSIIRPMALSESHISNPGELLNKSPGIEVIDGQASIRGGSGFAYGAGSRLLALIDGLPIISPDAGSIRWRLLPFENISQIEIIKGASSVLYGSSALNGIVNFRTASAKPEGTLSFFTEAGIYDSPRQLNWKWWVQPRVFSSLSVSHLKKYGNTDVGFATFIHTDPGYRQRNDESLGRVSFRLKHDHSKISGLSYGMNGSALFNNKIDFVLWENAETGALVHDTSTANRLIGKSFFIDPFISLKKEQQYSHEFRMRYQFLQNEFPDGAQIDSKAKSLYAEYQLWIKLTEGLNLNAGAVQNSSTVYSGFFGDHNSQNLAAYTQLDFSPVEGLKLVSGIRLEHNTLNGEGEKLVPLFRAGANYQLTPLTFLRGSYGQAYRYPSIAEKFAATTLGSVRIFPNPLLKPESGWNAELGIKQGIISEKLDGLIDLAFFYTQNKDLIEFLFGIYPDPNTGIFDLGFQANNTEYSRVYGMEMEFMLNTKVGRFNYSINGGYVFMYPTEFNPYTLKNTDVLLKYRRKHSAKLGISTSISRFEFGLQLFARSKILNIDDVFVNELTRESILPGFFDYWQTNNTGHFLADLNLGYRINANYTLSLAIKNLSNVEYMGRPGDIQPHRHFSFRLSGKF